MEDKKFLRLTDIESYKISHHLSNKVWDIVLQWDYFAKDTVGKQLVRAVDSISANIAEGFGRYHKKDKVKFYRYSQGSTLESVNWIEKAYNRNLINEAQYKELLETLKSLPRQINHLIKFTNEKLSV